LAGCLERLDERPAGWSSTEGEAMSRVEDGGHGKRTCPVFSPDQMPRTPERRKPKTTEENKSDAKSAEAKPAG
jgi:hypothetical protein